MKTRGYEISLKTDNLSKYGGDSCFPLAPGAAKIAYSEIASTKTKFCAPFCDNIIIIA